MEVAYGAPTATVAALQTPGFPNRRCQDIDNLHVAVTKGNFGPDTPAGQLMSDRQGAFDTITPQHAEFVHARC